MIFRIWILFTTEKEKLNKKTGLPSLVFFKKILIFYVWCCHISHEIPVPQASSCWWSSSSQLEFFFWIEFFFLPYVIFITLVRVNDDDRSDIRFVCKFDHRQHSKHVYLCVKRMQGEREKEIFWNREREREKRCWDTSIPMLKKSITEQNNNNNKIEKRARLNNNFEINPVVCPNSKWE